MTDVKLSEAGLLDVNFGDDPAATTPESGGGEPFVLDSEDKVNWLLRKIANLQAERERIGAQYDTVLKALESEEKSLRWRFEADLKAFAAMQIAKNGGRRKSLHLLQGTLSFRTLPQSVKVANAELALEYAKANGLSCVATVEKLQALTYREVAQTRLTNDGELLPGIEVLPECEVFRITFGKPSE
jgi:phage host-nuclease inhibitor protein Gam